MKQYDQATVIENFEKESLFNGLTVEERALEYDKKRAAQIKDRQNKYKNGLTVT